MEDSRAPVDRRTVLKTVPVATVGLAGCLGSSSGGGGNGSNGGSSGNSSSGGGSEQQYNWRIGTSGEETATHASGVAFSSIINENSDNIQMSAQTTGGTTANPRLIAQGDIDIAQCTAPMVWRANAGRPPYNSLSTTFTQTFSYMTLDIFLVKRNVDKLSGIKTIEDIPTDGSVRMSWGPRGTSAWDTMADAFILAGINNPEQKFDLQVMGLGDQAGAMRNGRLDIATVYTANTESLVGWIQELGSTTDIDVVRYPFDQKATQKSKKPLDYSVVPASVWNQDISGKEFPALSIGYFTTVPAEIPEQPIYEYTNILMKNKSEVRDASAVLSEFGPKFATKYLVKNGDVPVHPGTERWYRENNLWSDDLTSLKAYQG